MGCLRRPWLGPEPCPAGWLITPFSPWHQDGVGLMEDDGEGLRVVGTPEASRAPKEAVTSFMMLASQLMDSRSANQSWAYQQWPTFSQPAGLLEPSLKVYPELLADVECSPADSDPPFPPTPYPQNQNQFSWREPHRQIHQWGDTSLLVTVASLFPGLQGGSTETSIGDRWL